ncbi:acetate/propionate family kinase [Christensenella tenuis]|uniref:Acetate kinase n=1 Tax=Christensenella tenuis TaxID=2763033 RepID=A0ABR7EBX0_9FIRM|nr:acetate kinase [Christensenella tenuis]MBC5647236.1 acetate kinase [Christensenella tenuis]
MKNVLVINAGSSSLKYQLIDMESADVIAKGLVERIGIDGSVIKHKPAGKDKVEIETPMKDHNDAMKQVIAALTDSVHGVVSDLSGICAVGHRIVHGGEKFSESVLITDEVMEAIKENIELAPLHNPANLMGIDACRALMPDVPMVGVFDTAFHANMPQKAFLYGIPYTAYTDYKVRRYGFHGTSHKYVSRRAAELLGKDIKDLKIITCHLGNGSSVAAVDGGVSVDTSMGFTPLEGLVMGTRSGDLDAAIVPYLMDKMHMDVNQAINYLNKESGVWGISGVSSDFRDLWAEEEKGNERAKLALDVFNYRLKKFIGSYAAAMGGVDVITFAGGVGENDWDVRKHALEGLEFMGVKLDKEKNDGLRGEEMDISAPDSKVKILVIPTDEEMTIAKDTYDICCK